MPPGIDVIGLIDAEAVTDDLQPGLPVLPPCRIAKFDDKEVASAAVLLLG